MGELSLLDIPDNVAHISDHPKKLERLLEKGVEAISQGKITSALSYFEKAFHSGNSPVISSYFAFCIAKERGQVSKAISLCSEAIRNDPQNPIHYLNLGRIYLIAGIKLDAVKILREGLKHEKNRQIVDELDRLGARKPPIFPFLKRSNPLNKYPGILLRKLGLR
jgi:tetratricopeptide (TPR) repeat protein